MLLTMTAKTQGKPTDIIYRTNPEISKTHFLLKRNKNAPIMVLPPQYQLHTDEKGTDRQDLEDRVHKQIVFWYAHSQSDSVETRLPLKRTQLNTHCGDILFSEKKDWRLEQSAMLAIRQFMNVYSDHIFF